MTRTGLLSATALRSALFAGAALAIATPAMAQDAASQECPADQPNCLQSEPEIESGENADVGAMGSDVITVTGSRIRRPNLESTVPITSVGGEEFFETGNTSVGDLLNDLPALRSTFSQSNSARFLGTAGLNLLDLRGLGTQRTLVLVNGRRHVASDILNFATSVDTNTIPTDLIERVDVVTGGDSAIYGSDAIAGVVNFILKNDYEGIQLRAQGGTSKYGDAGSYFVSGLAGQNFADGRGNITLNAEYAHQEDFYASGRPNLRINSNFVTVDTDPAGSPNGSDGTPDRLFFDDIRSSLYTDAGTFLSTPVDGFYTPFIFQPDGTLAPQTGTRVGRRPFGSFIGGNGDNFRAGHQLGLSPRLDRYSANLLGHFTISDAFEPFIEAKYTRTDSLGNASGPYFTGATGSPREVFHSRSNPFITDQARGIIEGYYGDYYSDLNGNGVRDQGEYDGGNGVTDAEEFGFSILRNIEELGNREEKARRETYRIVGGVRGDFNEDWHYELSLNYGEFKERTAINGNVNLQRYLLAIDAVDQGQFQTGVANGNIVCRATLDPTTGVAFEGAVDTTFAAQQLANDIATCVPVNVFGKGNITQAARDYLLTNSFANGKITQFDALAFVSGDLSQWFELPGGPVGFALGAEYRRETAFYDQDEFSQSGLSFYNAIPTFDPPAFEVKEAFGEIRIPLLADTPFFQELTVNAAARVSDYRGATGTTYAYNAGVDWAPIRDLRLRANYSRAVRAPNLSDTGFPLSQNFSLVNDPCSDRNIGTGSANRAANCAADGVPAGYDFVYDSSLPFLSGGNPNLNEETSDSYTIGGVFQPSFLPGFALSVDYYNITVDDVIASVSAQTILDQCYDLADLSNQFCQLFERNQGPGNGPQGEIPGQILNNSLNVAPVNFAKLKVSGIDSEVSYRHTFTGIGAFNTRLTYTHVISNDSFLDPTDPGRADRALYELGDPRDAFNWDVELKTGPFTIGYQMRYIGKMVLNEYEDFFSVQGRDPENADYADRRFYPDVFYHDIRLGIDATDNFNFYVGVENIANRLPPLGLTGVGGGSAIYQNRGRFFYAGAKATF